MLTFGIDLKLKGINVWIKTRMDIHIKTWKALKEVNIDNKLNEIKPDSRDEEESEILNA